MRRRAVIVVAVCGVLACLGALAPRSRAAEPALFRVGAASRSLAPPVAVYSGGFGLSPPITRMRDPLQVRAFYVSNGRHAVAFAVVDAQGYFASYQEGAGLGITGDRVDSARAMNAAGAPGMTAADVVVQATHSHAGPTLEGIWGPVPPEYLRLVHDQVVAALAAAAAAAAPAHVQFATIDDPNIAAVNINQDNYQGFVNDPQISVLRAVSPADGSTIATFASVPVHGAHIRGDQEQTLSADWFGAVRAALDERLGGVAVVGPATLGRLESPVETTGATNMEWLSGVIANDVTEALAHGRWLTDGTLASAEQMVQVPATNAALMALNDAWSLPDAIKAQEAQQTGVYPIDRSTSAPYRTGNVLSTYLTALRVGDVAFLSMPGEPFPEIRLSIAQGTNARNVVALSKAQDDFGYFFPSFVAPFPEVYNSDHAVFNIAPQAGDQIIQGQLANIGAVGFTTSTTVAQPLNNDYAQKVRPGLQALASPPTGDADATGRFTATLQAIYMPASVIDAPLAGPVHWNFGDGTQGDTGFLVVGQDYGQTGQGPQGRPLFDHAFPVGTHVVTASGQDTSGNPVSWSLTVRVFPRLVASAACRRASATAPARLSVATAGGEGTVLRSAWRFPDGATAEGESVAHGFAAARGSGTVTVLDAAGGQASATATCATAARHAKRVRRRRAARRHRPARRHHAHPRFTG